MKNRLMRYMFSVFAGAMLVSLLPVNLMSLQAVQEFTEEVTLPVYQAYEGVFGEADGFYWSYDKNTKTVTVTGSDSGLNDFQSVLPYSVFENMQKIIFQDCVVSGSMASLLAGLYDIESVEFHNIDTTNVTDMSYMFDRCNMLRDLDLSSFNTANVLSMERMFAECYALNRLNVSSFDTGKVENMRQMFAECGPLLELDLSNFNTGNVLFMDRMFATCSSLRALNLSSFSTANVRTMSEMFEGCGSLSQLDISGFDTGQVRDMSGMFSGCSGLTVLDVSHFETKNVNNMHRMFEGCSSVSVLDVSGFNTKNVGDMGAMFSGCSSLRELDVSNFNTGSIRYQICVGNMSYMFNDCSSLETLDVSGFYTKEVMDMSYMFHGCSSLSELNVSNFETNFVGSMSHMFSGCSGLTELDIRNFVTSDAYYERELLDMSYMFHGCSGLKELDLSTLDITKVEVLDGMLGDCNLESIKAPKKMAEGQRIKLPYGYLDSKGKRIAIITPDYCQRVLKRDMEDTRRLFGDNNGFLCSFDESTGTFTVEGADSGLNEWRLVIRDSELENLKHMVFQDCVVSGSLTGLLGGLEEIESAHFLNVDTTNVTDMSYMFAGCSSLSKLDVSSFDTGNVTNMSGMFDRCVGLTEVDVSSFDTGNVTDMNTMFYFCEQLSGLDVSGFDTSNVTDIRAMFCGCSSLSELDLSNFDITNIDSSKIYALSSVFTYCCLETLRTPKAMKEGKKMELPYAFMDSEGNHITVITAEHCNKTLVKDERTPFGDKNGFFWIFEESTGTLTVTGEDSGLNRLKKILPESVMDNLKHIVFQDCVVRGSMASMLSRLKNLQSVVFYNFDTTNVTDMSFMVNNCSGLSELDLSGFDAGNVTDMRGIFEGCDNLNSIKTPKNMAEGLSVELPDVFCDAEKNSVTELTSIHCNKLLTRKEKEYLITYHLEGGKNSKSNPGTYTKSLPTITLKAPTKTGYAFSGWYSDCLYQTRVTEINTGSTENVNLYAKWTPNKYTINFHKNGATSGTMKALSNRKYGSSYNLSANKFKRKGYSFSGWNTQKNGSGKNYKDKAIVKNLVSVSGKSITLYAQWKKESYKITYKLNGGKNHSSNPKKYDITTKTITLKAPTRKGYTFKGWYGDSKFKKKVTKIKKGSTGKVTLYAKWEKNKTKK